MQVNDNQPTIKERPLTERHVSSLTQIWHVAVHEILTLLRSRRVLAVLILYLIFAILGSLGYVAALEQIEQQMRDVLLAGGTPPDQVSTATSILSSDAYKKILAFFVGAKPEQLASVFLESPFVPVILGASLMLLPYLVLLLGYDLVITEVESRSICYVALRISRSTLVLGKYLAHALIFCGLTAVCSVVLLLLAMRLSGVTDQIATATGLLRVWLSLIPYGLCYLGMIVLSSTLVEKRRSALTFAVVVLFVFQLMAWAHHLPNEGVWQWLQHLRWLSPSTYTDGLWLAGVVDPLIHVGALTAFALFFTVAAIFRLNRRDL